MSLERERSEYIVNIVNPIHPLYKRNAQETALHVAAASHTSAAVLSKSGMVQKWGTLQCCAWVVLPGRGKFPAAREVSGLRLRTFTQTANVEQHFHCNVRESCRVEPQTREFGSPNGNCKPERLATLRRSRRRGSQRGRTTSGRTTPSSSSSPAAPARPSGATSRPCFTPSSATLSSPMGPATFRR